MKNSRENILKTAFRLFLQKSYKEVTMSEIVNESGLSKGAFYHYFESKEQLFVEVVKTFYFQKMIVDYSKLNNNSLYEFYHQYVEHVIKKIREIKEYLNYNDTVLNINYITIMFDALKLFPEFHNDIKAAQQKELDAWIEAISIARNKKEFSSPMTDLQIAMVFIYSQDGIGLHLLLEGRLADVQNEMLTLWDHFYKELIS